MVLTKDQLVEFEAMSRPIMKFLSDNCHPYVVATITYTDATLLEEFAGIHTTEFVKD